MGIYTIFYYVRKSEDMQTSTKFNNKNFENSRSQIVFRTDIFRKLSLGAPDLTGNAILNLSNNGGYSIREAGLYSSKYKFI